ncbi:hypothetical protein MGYG_03052 [Nannizzia gypsea CBS 118893]|uniref:Uncharacterized protein n=1 Tax=Arthroderma gypseum (strain ATCC MYA-4604 / CBS 118893) TaxID=535722 RepID=E4UQH6_ARTGP|nr:hypothetical protein MGYG_03052 [Nannizzia gypsea CBS 118893]EFR00046.1 hypothetical protein MGYG_03052 [Nannizzia gypsea CBS 118893]
MSSSSFSSPWKAREEAGEGPRSDQSVDEHRSVLRTAHAHACQYAWYQGGPAEGGSGMLNLELKRSPGGYELPAIKAMLARMR